MSERAQTMSDTTSRQDEERKMKEYGRLPPGQSLTRKFPVLTAGPTPAFDAKTWDLRVFGEVTKEMSWGWEEFLKIPSTIITTDIHCVTQWSKFDTMWEGVLFRDLVELFGVKDSAQHVIAHCEHGYTTNVPLEDMNRDNVLLAYKYGDEWLEPDHGGPLRTLVPHLYLWKSAKFLRALEFSTVDKPGYWEQVGYHNYGDPFKEQRYGPRDGFVKRF